MAAAKLFLFPEEIRFDRNEPSFPFIEAQNLDRVIQGISKGGRSVELYPGIYDLTTILELRFWRDRPIVRSYNDLLMPPELPDTYEHRELHQLTVGREMASLMIINAMKSEDLIRAFNSGYAQSESEIYRFPPFIYAARRPSKVSGGRDVQPATVHECGFIPLKPRFFDPGRCSLYGINLFARERQQIPKRLECLIYISGYRR